MAADERVPVLLLQDSFSNLAIQVVVRRYHPLLVLFVWGIWTRSHLYLWKKSIYVKRVKVPANAVSVAV